jgi:5'(3')-deoxyribonucleotidase
MKQKCVLFCDLDGVLTDFDKAVIHYHNSIWAPMNRVHRTDCTWARPLAKSMGSQWYEMIRSTPFSYWAEMDWKEDGRLLWDGIRHLAPIILTTPAPTEACITGKASWIREHLGDVPSIIEPHKHRYVTEDCLIPDDLKNCPRILIDDMEKNINPWKEAGGIGILHKNAKETLSILMDYMNSGL